MDLECSLDEIFEAYEELRRIVRNRGYFTLNMAIRHYSAGGEGIVFEAYTDQPRPQNGGEKRTPKNAVMGLRRILEQPPDIWDLM